MNGRMSKIRSAHKKAKAITIRNIQFIHYLDNLLMNIRSYFVNLAINLARSAYKILTMYMLWYFLDMRSIYNLNFEEIWIYNI